MFRFSKRAENFSKSSYNRHQIEQFFLKKIVTNKFIVINILKMCFSSKHTPLASHEIRQTLYLFVVDAIVELQTENMICGSDSVSRHLF